jgi:hypothetical protein
MWLSFPHIAVASLRDVLVLLNGFRGFVRSGTMSRLKADSGMRDLPVRVH